MERKIVLIEDDTDTRTLLHDILSKHHTVVTYTDGRPLLEPSFNMPDLFIIDYHLPSIDGTALCKYLRLKTDPDKVPVIIISGNENLENKTLNAGASAYLKKPFSTDQLLSLTRHLIGDRNDSRQQPE
jgi:DNA-binding response OmpR family regulator